MGQTVRDPGVFYENMVTCISLSECHVGGGLRYFGTTGIAGDVSRMLVF